MSDPSPKTISPESLAQGLFTRLRKRGFNLGMGEYLDAIAAIRGGMGAKGLNDLKLVLELLWCHSLAEQTQFDEVWQDVVAVSSGLSSKEILQNPPKPEQPPKQSASQPEPLPPQRPEPFPPSSPDRPELAPLPVRTPFIPVATEEAEDLQLYFPVTRRSLSYLWRYLRRPVADGPADVLDVETTVRQVVQQGFYLAPAYQRRDVNHAHLLLFIDQDGSMMPFHRFTRDLVETALEDSSIEAVNAYYFHNIPAESLYTDTHLTQAVPLDRVLTACDRDTSVLIVSDAGAARGYRRMERVRETTEFLVRVKQRTALISWLNPLPADRWEATSAELIAYLVRMEEMDDDGVSKAIDIVRGQVTSPAYGG